MRIPNTALRYGPYIRFVYTFPQPSRYQLWAQSRRAGKVVTVPVTLEVEESRKPASPSARRPATYATLRANL